MLSALILVAAVAPGGMTDADVAVLVQQSLVSDVRGSVSADALGRATNRRPDGDVARDVLAVLRLRLGNELGSLAVTCNKGVVRLRGTAASAAVSEQAGVLAGAVSGARQVDNQLRTPEGDETLPDPGVVVVIEEPVVGPFAFLTRDGLAAADVIVEVQAGVVTLHGRASSPRARDYATAAARVVPGARLVKNLMQVREVSKEEDARLQKLILRQLEWSGALRPVLERVTVSVRDGVVRLEGSGLSAAQAAEAVRLAAGTSGVLLVDDRLQPPG